MENGGPIAPSRHVLGILMFRMFSPSPALSEAHGGFVWPFAPGKPPKLDVLNKWQEQITTERTSLP